MRQASRMPQDDFGGIDTHVGVGVRMAANVSTRRGVVVGGSDRISRPSGNGGAR